MRDIPRRFAFLLLGALCLYAPSAQPQGGSSVSVFGPKKYLRTTGAPNEYTDTFNVPAWVVAPFTLHIQNGEPDGDHRVSSATIKINGKTIVKQSDFNQNVAGIDRQVTLTAKTTLKVTLASQPGSFLIINLGGASADHTPPSLAVAKPTEGQALKTATPAFEITYNDPRGSEEPAASGVNTATLSVTLDGTDRTELFEVRPDGASATLPPELALADGTHTLEATVADRAGNAAPKVTRTFVVDTVAPTITAAAAPPPNAAGWNNADVTVTFTCEDAGSGVATCPATQTVTAEGAEQKITGTAEDKAGNTATASVTVSLDKTPPTITATVTPSPNAAGWSGGDVTVTFTCTDALSGVASCPAPVVVSTEGAGQVVQGTATDAAGNTATASATVNLDRSGPSITAFVTPDQLPPGGSGTVSVEATDNVAIASVTFSVDGSTVATLTAPPYQFELTVPAEAQAGDTLTVTVVVTDQAGNTATASRGVAIAAQGVVVGQVLADATSLPLPGAVVQVVGGALQDVSDAAGRYALPADRSHLFLRIAKPGMLPVEREVAVQSGVGTVAVDARLTAAASPVEIDSAGGTLTSTDLSVVVPPGAVAAPTPFSLTRLSGQGLPALLPLGWSPVAAFDLSAGGTVGGPLAAGFAGVPANQPLQLVTYDVGAHAWVLVEADLTSPDGVLAATLPAPGAYALVLADETDPPLAAPAAGQPLPGASMVLVPPDAASSGTLAPPSLSPAGGTAMATLAVSSSLPLPSGTVLQATVTELYTPTSGEPISEAARPEDLVLYRHRAPAGAALAAEFPVTPSRSFAVADLLSGKVHLDILAGREGTRGQTGGSGPVVVQSGDAQLAVAAGSLPEDTAIALLSVPLAGFLPSGNGLTPLAQFFLDFSGRILGLPAQLSSSAGVSGGAQPGDTLLLARIERFDGVPRLVAVSLAQVVGERIVSQPYPGLPGITLGGEYVFYRSTQPLGFVSGLVTAAGGPVSALVQTDELPFVTLSDATGRYTMPAVAGTAHLRASVPRTALLATGSVAVTAGQTSSLDLVLAGSVTSATVAPPDGAVGVDPTAAITITAAVALNPATVTAGNVQLFEVGSSGNQPVAVRFVLAQGNRQVSVFPLAVLEPSTRYTLQVSGLATAVGGLVAVPSISFTTRAVTPPNFNPDALVFSFPDDEGNVAVSAPANSFPPGSRVQIVNQTNGVVLTLTAFNDGSVSGELPATIDDVLEVTVTAPDTSTATFTRTQFVAPDGTVAVGSHGGTVTGEGGVELRVPEGALVQAVRLKIEAFGPELFPERPDVPNGNFGGGLKVSSPDSLSLKKEIDLAFPKPADAPDGSFYYVYRRLATEDNEVAFEVIDQAFVEGDKVVTSSAPFPGFITGMAGLGSNAVTAPLAAGLEENYFYLQWTFERELVGVASQGVIVGKVRRIVPPGPGQTDPTFVPIAGAMVFLSDDDQLAGGGSVPSQMAVSQGDGFFALWDRRLGGGTRKVKAVAGNESVEVTAFEVNAAEADPVFFPNLETFRYYRNVAKANVAFPPLAPPPPAPQVDIRMFTLDADGLRVPATGVLQTGTSLVIAFKSTLTVTGATVGGVPQTVSTPDLPDSPQDPLRFNSRVAGTLTVGPPGTYTVVATALPPLGGPAVTATRSFLAVAAGGDNTSPLSGPPAVINTFPIANATRVATTAFPQVTFSEPVTKVPGNVTLADSSGNSADLRLIGIKPDGSVANPVKATDAITALTLQPTTGLKFGETYTLTLKSGIVDLDQLQLAQFTLRFTTFGPQELGATAPFSSTRPVVVGQRAYVAKVVNSYQSSLNIVDVSDPSNPAEIGSPQSFAGRAIDIAGVEMSPATQGPLVAVATGVGSVPRPSNVWIFDVSDPDVPKRVAAVSATTSAGQEGTLLRLAMKGSLIYTSTFPKGIQVIDVREAIAAYEERKSSFLPAIFTEGQGFANDAVVNTIELKTGDGGIGTMYDVEVGDFAMAPPDPNDPSASVPTERLVVATGRVPLVVVDPLQSGPSAVLYPPRQSGTTGLSSMPLQSADGRFKLELGFTAALGSIQRIDEAGNSSQLPVAVVAGHGTATTGGTTASGIPILAVVDMSDVRHPAPLGFLKLRAFAVDIALQDSLALIGTGAEKILLVSLQDPANPFDAGAIAGTFGDRLVMADPRTVVTSSYNGAIGGIRTAILGSACAALRTFVPPGLPSTNPIPTSDPSQQLAWSFTSQLTQRDGLVLTDVKLGRRLMAKKMSLPFVKLQRKGESGTLLDRFELSPTSTTPTKRVRLLSYASPAIGSTVMSIEARYLIDFLDGNVEQSPELPDSCLVVTQRYEFFQEGLSTLEPFGLFPSARFVPQVKYSYFTDAGGPKLESFTSPQRLVFDARTPPQGQALDPKADANATLLSCDPDPGNQYCWPSIFNLAVVGLLHNANPLEHEEYLKVIDKGTMNRIADSEAIFDTIVDNFHSSPQPRSNPDQKIDEPSPTQFGCPACVHVHWRWSSILKTGSVADYYPGAVIEPTFNNNDGKPFLPPGSNQDVDIALESSAIEHPNEVRFLVSTGRSILPSSLGTSKPVFWYVGTGRRNSDQFFTHGGGFGTFYVNKISVPQSDLLTLQIEHTRDVEYEINITEKVQVDRGIVAFPRPVFRCRLPCKLPAGQDDLVVPAEIWRGWDPISTKGVDVHIKLIDPALAQRGLKSEYVKRFDITSPGQKEP